MENQGPYCLIYWVKGKRYSHSSGIELEKKELTEIAERLASENSGKMICKTPANFIAYDLDGDVLKIGDPTKKVAIIGLHSKTPEGIERLAKNLRLPFSKKEVGPISLVELISV